MFKMATFVACSCCKLLRCYVMVKSAVQDLLFPVRVTPVTEQRPAAAARPFTLSWGGAGGRAALLD